MTQSVILSDPRDVREFVAAKKRKREPIRWHAHGVTEAACEPRTLAEFSNLRAGLRTSDFGQASDRLDALESALRTRHQIGLPKPRKVTQNSDCSLTIWWEGAMVRCFPNGLMSLIGGVRGIPARAITSDLLDLLAIRWRIAT
jgi:hypothetical protein